MLKIIVLSPAGFPSTGLARSVQRAGYYGGVALEYLAPAETLQVIRTLQLGSLPFTVSTSSVSSESCELLLASADYGLQRVILTDLDQPLTSGQAAAFRQRGIEVLAEVCSLGEALQAQESGADALVVKGSEGGGRVGHETTFILLQQIIPEVSVPVWARGGVGLHTASACLTAGAHGVVLDWQAALVQESSLPEAVRARVQRMDGSETAVVGGELSCSYRVFSRPTEAAFVGLRALAVSIAGSDSSPEQKLEKWRQAVADGVRARRIFLMGQDACFAAPLSSDTPGVRSLCRAFSGAAVRQIRSALKHQAIRSGGPLAVSQGTRYPIVQGPMTRVSDTADFAQSVAEAGGVPFLGLGLSPASQLESLLAETGAKLGKRPWGVGIIGFMDKALLEEQLSVVRKHRPPFAVIAGGRPDQAKALKEYGTEAYVHVPSPELLRIFLQAGLRRMIFEGRECGGHIGPRTSFVLWESMIRVILQHLVDSGDDPAGYHVLFAGGIHDARSAAMVDALAAPLSERGVCIGVVLGTAYLFAEEAVTGGAIVDGFQQAALACERTVELESGVGHATRCADTPFVSLFLREKQRLLESQRPAEEVRRELEALNLGRMRVAAKGLLRQESAEEPVPVPADGEYQQREGMYMIGQLAAMRNEICTMGGLHKEVCSGRALLKAALAPYRVRTASRGRKSSDIAIVGISCLFPGAEDTQDYWHNILNRVNAIREIPKERWDWELYFDSDRSARDKIYSKWGGFLDDFVFDPVKYGMPPSSVASVEPLQLLVLELTRRALEDAGYAGRPFDREHTSVVFGAGGGVGDIGLSYGFRSMMPFYMTEAGATAEQARELIDRLGHQLPEWTEDSFAGLLLNVIAGRVSNRFDLGGGNYTVDAACASSLAALRLAMNELETGASNMAIVGAADTMQSPFCYLCFSKTQALSPTGECRTLDESADGIVIGEGIAVAILKRLEDAVGDGDRIYAVLKGVGSSSDGKDKGLTAPRPVGQVRALERAYQKAGFSPATVGLIEAHGTGTEVGDWTEIESLSRVFQSAEAEVQRCAVGSVKSMIGHTKCVAGLAGMIKVALALKHKMLPPTMGVKEPNKKANFSESPFYVNTLPKPWVRRPDQTPRRAGVSAFGFGGTNFHAVLEEYSPREDTPPAQKDWPAELLIWRGVSLQDIVQPAERLLAALVSGSAPRLADLASAVCSEHGRRDGPHCLAISAASSNDLKAKLEKAVSRLKRNPEAIKDASGVYYACPEGAGPAPVAFLFPGQGSQRVNMLADLALAYPGLVDLMETADLSLDGQLEKPLSEFMFPPPAFTPEEEAVRNTALTRTNVAQPAMGVAGMAYYHLLQDLGIQPAFAGGHSYGELTALCAAGVFSFEDLIRISEARGRLILEAARDRTGTMAAAAADEAAVSAAIKGVAQVWIANLNSPKQTVISGTEEAVTAALARLKSAGISASRIPVSCAFHSALVSDAAEPLAELLESVHLAGPVIPVFSNTTAAPHGREPRQIRRRLAEHLEQPVRFVEQVEAMHAAGARIFIEVGPGRVLTGLVKATLAGREFTAVALDHPGRHAAGYLCQALAQLAVAGVSFNTVPLFEGRVQAHAGVAALLEQSLPAKPSPTAFVIRAGKAVPLSEKLKGFADKKVRPSSAISIDVQPADPALASPAGVPGTGQPRPAAPQRASAAARGAAGSARQAAMDRHSQLMGRFLETQRSIMQSYLNGREAPAAAQGLPETEVELSEAPVSPPISATPTEARRAQPAVETPVPDDDSSSVPAVPELNEKTLTEHLVGIVSERTGYPPEMLGLDMDLEADLGIDSIKRVEILSALQTGAMPGLDTGDGDAEALSSLKTLKAIVGWILDSSGPASPAETAGETTAPPRRPEPAGEPVSRLRVEVVEACSPPDAAQALSGPVLVIDDGGGVGTALCRALTRMGIAACLVGSGANGGNAPRRIDLCDPAAVSGFVDEFQRESGPVAAVVHLMPLCPCSNLEPGRWESRLNEELRSLFVVCRALEPELSRSGTVLAATRMGGDFQAGPQRNEPDFWPGHAAVCGFVKSLAHEWKSARCKAVDFALKESTEAIVGALLAELEDGGGPTEIGYLGQRRITLQSVPAPLAESPAVPLSLDRDGVVVVTAGAYGVTAKLAVAIAEQAACRMVIVGRSPAPAPAESPETAGVTESRSLKAALMQSLARPGSRPSLKEVEQAYRTLVREREMRANFEKMEKAGAAVEYCPVDVTDAEAFGSLIDQIYSRHGRVDGVIHGAGIIEDKLLRDKTPESFGRVLAPKVRGALSLAAKLHPESLKFLVFMSSVSGRYGNRGQSDYAAANEFLNKLAVWLNGRWPARVLSINWGPWQTADGMVSAELAKHFTRAGVQLIPAEEGGRIFMNELTAGRGDTAEVIWGGPLQGAAPRPAAEPAAAPRRPFPLLETANPRPNGNGTAETVITVDPRTDIYLQDHQLDGTPVLPMAMVLELFAEMAAEHWPNRVLTGIRNLNVLKGISFEGLQPRRLYLRAASAAAGERLEVHLQLAPEADPRRIYYSAVADLAAGGAAPPEAGKLDLVDPRPLVQSVAEAYRSWLFHGPLFAGIQSVEAVGTNGIIGTLRSSDPRRLFDRPVRGRWQIDPVAVDSALQLLILWSRQYLDMTPLPSRLEHYHFGGPLEGELRCLAEIRHEPGSRILSADIRLLDRRGRPAGRLEGMQVTCSKSLNRLGRVNPTETELHP